MRATPAGQLVSWHLQLTDLYYGKSTWRHLCVETDTKGEEHSMSATLRLHLVTWLRDDCVYCCRLSSCSAESLTRTGQWSEESILYLQLLVQRSVRLQPELRAAVLMPDELRSSGCVQRQAIQPLARTVPQQLGLNQPPHHRVVLQERAKGLTLSWWI